MTYLMKHDGVRLLVGFILMLHLTQANAQQVTDSKNIEVTFNKTSTLIFPTVITAVDRGSKDVLAQKVKGAGNVLQLKAARENFQETNLTVITGDGRIHQFTINYCKEPVTLVVETEEHQRDSSQPVVLFETAMTESELEGYSEKVVHTKKTIRFIKADNHKISLALMGIYIQHNVIFYHLQIENKSNITYDVEFLRFYIRDKSNVKRTASQEVNVIPSFIYGDDRTISGKSTTDVVYALEKFTIPDAKNLVIEMFEKKGGRHLNLSIKNKTIVNARLLPAKVD
ncbi:MAG: conjugative transposon protein TraN [Cyclobacteriaceae bacterium]|nr:conjugative transposon protein TraN [Cyclobacteriaceae bacterium]